MSSIGFRLGGVVASNLLCCIRTQLHGCIDIIWFGFENFVRCFVSKKFSWQAVGPNFDIAELVIRKTVDPFAFRDESSD